MWTFARAAGLSALLAVSAGCLSIDPGSRFGLSRRDMSLSRNQDFDPAILVGMEWGEASRVIRANGWLCQIAGADATPVPCDIDFARLSPQRQYDNGYHRLLISLRDGKVASAQKTHIL